MMHVKNKVLTSVIALTALCVSPLAAQITSNTSNATSGLFSTDVDYFLDVNDWQNVEFGKFFTTMQVGGTEGIGAGFAVNAGSAYLGAGYIGNFWSAGSTVNSTTTEYGDKYANANWRGKKIINDRSGSGLQWNSRVFLFLGTAPIGGLLLEGNFVKAGKNNLDKEYLDSAGDLLTDENSQGLGEIEAGLRWGRNFDLGGGLTLKPNLAFSYNTNLQKSVTYKPGGAETTELNGSDSFFASTAYKRSVNDGKVGLTGYMAGHAGLSVDLSKSTGDGSLWFGYDLEQHLYDKQTTDNSDYWKDYNPSYAKHYIDIGVGAWYTLDRKLSLGWSAGSGFNIENAKVTSAKESYGTGPEREFTEVIFGINPSITAGVVFKALPNRLSLNGSIALYPVGYEYDKLTEYNSVSAITTETTTNTISSTKAETSLGFTWFIADGLSFDAYVTTHTNGSRLNLTDFSALLSYKR
jgi:hypothetical protein